MLNLLKRHTHLKVPTADDQVYLLLPLLARLLVAPFDASINIVERAMRAAYHGDAERALGGS